MPPLAAVVTADDLAVRIFGAPEAAGVAPCDPGRERVGVPEAKLSTISDLDDA